MKNFRVIKERRWLSLGVDFLGKILHPIALLLSGYSCLLSLLQTRVEGKSLLDFFYVFIYAFHPSSPIYFWGVLVRRCV